MYTSWKYLHTVKSVSYVWCSVFPVQEPISYVNSAYFQTYQYRGKGTDEATMLRFVQSFYIFKTIIGHYDYNINTTKQQTMQATETMLYQN